jgi:hypothetical protein
MTWTLTVTLTLLVPAAMALACPMCKESIPNSDAEQAGGLPGGFNASVYYMLIGVFATAGLVIGVITRGVRSANARMKPRDPSLPPS